MRKTVVIVALALIPVCLAHAQVPEAERDALILFYYAAGGPGWTYNPGWASATVGTECSWYGVLCNSGHIYVLRLPDNNLTGTISSSLGDLSPSYFGRLELNDNDLTGSIPPELGNLGLTHLYLQTNRLSGNIPPELGDLSLLIGLDLSDNQLTGSIPPELGNLSNLAGLYLESNQLGGIIPPELGNMSKLWSLQLQDNQLTGSIPPSLGTLPWLSYLYLDNNQLTGSIPPELGNCPNLQYVDLSNNQLSGSIPSNLGSLVTLKRLFLNANELSGNIPPELGDLAAVQYLYLKSNKLSGEIPTDLMDLSALAFGAGLDISWNALYSSDGPLIAFLDMMHNLLWPWQVTQTIAPENLTVGAVGNHTVWLSWDAVGYQFDPGGYEAFSSPTGSGVWTSGGWTESKATTNFPVTGLDPGTIYDFAVVTYTDPHADNLNLVNSDFSTEQMQTTANTGCGQPAIEKTGAGPFTLALTESYDSYDWSTGETTASIVVAPSSEQWYWVTVASAGPCEETAAILVSPVPPSIFSDGFESGDTTEWSNAVP